MGVQHLSLTLEAGSLLLSTIVEEEHIRLSQQCEGNQCLLKLSARQVSDAGVQKFSCEANLGGHVLQLCPWQLKKRGLCLQEVSQLER